MASSTFRILVDNSGKLKRVLNKMYTFSQYAVESYGTGIKKDARVRLEGVKHDNDNDN